MLITSGCQGVSATLCDLIISEDRNELMMSDLDAREDPEDRGGTEQRRRFQ